MVLTHRHFVQPEHLDYLIAAANLHAYNYGLKGDRDPALFQKVVSSMEIPEFAPKSGIKIQIRDEEPVNNEPSGKSKAIAGNRIRRWLTWLCHS
jgi:ubiquitin-activating enzyme E1